MEQPIKVVDDAAAEKADYIVCMRLLGGVQNLAMIPASRIGKCARCNETVYWSPVAPKKPPRLCLECFEADQAKKKADKAEKALKAGENPEGLTDAEEDDNVMCTTDAVIADTLRTLKRADALRDLIRADVESAMQKWEKPGKHQIN